MPLASVKTTSNLSRANVMPEVHRTTAPYANRRTATGLVSTPVDKRRTPGSKQNYQSQNEWVWVILLTAVIAVGIGVLTLTGYAQLTNESFRRVRLMSQLDAAREKSERLAQIKAHVSAPLYIETEAQKLHMVRADDKQTVTVSNNSVISETASSNSKN